MHLRTPNTSGEALQRFSCQHALDNLSESTITQLFEGHLPIEKAEAFEHFYRRIEADVFSHPVITDNPYTPWFAEADLSDHEVRHFVVQFSVFSNQFLVAQLNKMINARTPDAMHSSKEILANEIGVVFNNRHATVHDHELGDTEGSVEGGTFHFSAAHFEILCKLGEKLGLKFEEMGRREHGTPSTLFFCDELIRLYGSEDFATAEAASFAVEHWAAAGFWKELTQGLDHYRKARQLKLPLTFFTWHDRIEDNHAHHTKEELEHYYFSHDINEDAFIDDALEMLDGVYAFWKGLDNDRRRLRAAH